MRNAVASKPRASLDGTPRASHGAPTGGGGSDGNGHRSFFAALNIDSEPSPSAETNGSAAATT